MASKTFFDANVLVYLFDADAPTAVPGGTPSRP
jgi:hypothetical protein